MADGGEAGKHKERRQREITSTFLLPSNVLRPATSKLEERERGERETERGERERERGRKRERKKIKANYYLSSPLQGKNAIQTFQFI